MKTLELSLEDGVIAELESVSARQQRDAASLAGDLVLRYLEAERARQVLQSPDLIALYSELADDDVMLAESGIGDFARLLEEADGEGER